jgi:hypothetical protein
MPANAHTHTDANTVKSLCQLSFEMLKPPAYRPDLPIICHSDIQEVKQVVHVWHVFQPATFFSEGIQKLVDQSRLSLLKSTGTVYKNDANTHCNCII